MELYPYKKLQPQIENENKLEIIAESFQAGILDYTDFVIISDGEKSEKPKRTKEGFRSPKDYIKKACAEEGARDIDQRSRLLGFGLAAAKYRDPSSVFEILKNEGLLADDSNDFEKFTNWLNDNKNFVLPKLKDINNPIEKQLGIEVDPLKEIQQMHLFNQLTQAIKTKDCRRAYEIAIKCCGQTVDATHGTWDSGMKSILKEKEIWSSEGGHHYYGNGVYIGMNGGFRHWGEQKLIYFRNVPSENLLPVINAKEPMANIPADKVKLQGLDWPNGFSPDDDFFFVPSLVEATPVFQTGSYKFPGFLGSIDKEALKQIDELLGLVKVEKAFDDYYGIYDRVYVREKRPLICMAVMNTLPVSEIVWDEKAELPVAKPLNLENQENVNVVIKQILSCYETEGRNIDSPHGRRHIERVIENINILCTEIKADIKTRHLAMLAAAAHDIIRHAEKNISPNWASALWAKRLLKGLLDYNSLKEIRDAIVQHNGPREARIRDTVITQLLYDADKMDTRADRFHMKIEKDSYDEMADGLFEDYIEMVLDSISSKTAKTYLENLLEKQKQRKEKLPHIRL
jgi:hypothetical protein